MTNSIRNQIKRGLMYSICTVFVVLVCGNVYVSYTLNDRLSKTMFATGVLYQATVELIKQNDTLKKRVEKLESYYPPV